MKSSLLIKRDTMDAMMNAISADPDEVTEETLQIVVAKAIWAIAGVSPEHENAVLDTLGIQSYLHIAELQKK